MKYQFCIIAILALAGCSSAPDEIKIGAILHLTGNTYAYTGNAMREGIDLAVFEINAQGGIHGKKIRVIYEDDGDGDNVRATTAARKLLEVDNVHAAFVESYMQGMAIGPLFEQNKVPLIVLWDANKELEDAGNYIFATGPWTESAGERLSDFSIDDLNLTRVAVIHHATEWSTLIAKFFSAKFALRGGQIVSSQAIQPDTQDFRTIILKALSTQPEAIYAPVEFEAGLFFKQLKDAGFNGTLMSSDQINLQIIENAQGGAEGLYYTLFMPEEDNVFTNALRQKYIAHFGKKPDQLLYNGFGYEGIMAIIAAINQSGSEPSQITQGLYDLDGAPGAFGPITFTPGGSSAKFENVFQVLKGQEVFVKN